MLRQTQMSKEKPGLRPGQICLTRTRASPVSSLICLTKYELSKIPDLKDLDFLQPCSLRLSRQVQVQLLEDQTSHKINFIAVIKIISFVLHCI